MASAIADTSPMQPGMLPTSMSQSEGTPLHAALQSPCGDADAVASATNHVFITARGVAVVAASGVFHQNGLSHVVIGPVKEMSMNARAASAGDCGHPKRDSSREIEREKKTRQHCREVAYRVLALHRQAAKRFRHDARRDAHGDSPHRRHPEEIDSHRSRRKKRDDDVEHYARHACVRMRVRRRAEDVMFGGIFWFHVFNLPTLKS